MKRLIPALLALLLFGLPCWAGVSCHCFRDREYDPTAPDKVDPYLLATTRNGLLAGAAGLEKGDVVKARMTGSTETDVWLSHVLAVRVGVAPHELFQAKEAQGTWIQALDALSVAADAGGARLAKARKAGEDEGLARALADQTLLKAFALDPAELADLRDRGANTAEIALASELAGDAEKPADLFVRVIEGQRTWGQLLTERGVAPGELGDRVAQRTQKAFATAP